MKTFQVETLLNGHIDVLSLLFYLHEKQATGIRDLLINMLYDLTPNEIDSVLPQLIHLWVRWEQTPSQCLSEFFLFQCAHSLHFTLKCMWILAAEEGNAKSPITVRRIQDLTKMAEMAHVNSEIPPQRKPTPSPPAPNGHTPMRRSATHDLQQIANVNAADSSSRRLPVSSTSLSRSSSAAAGTNNQLRSPRPNGQLPPPTVARSARLVQVVITPTLSSSSSPSDPLVQLKIVPVLTPLTPTYGPQRSPNPTTAPRPIQQQLPQRPRVADGPHAAFTSSASWKPQRASSSPPMNGQPAGQYLPRPTNGPRSNSPAVIRSPPSAHSSNSDPLLSSMHASPSPSFNSSSSPVLRPALKRTESEDQLPNDFLSSSASPITPKSENDDVDWPDADQDMPKSIPSATSQNIPMQRMTQQSMAKRYASIGAVLRNRHANRASLNASPTDSVRSITSPGGVGVAEPILFHLLSKQVRSEYFNLELLLFSTLHDLSVALAKLVVTERNPVLREQLYAIDRDMIRGLYFPIIPHSPPPTSTCVGAHYKILRILPEECWSLASRDKAPFLMHVEIAYAPADEHGNRMSCYSGQVYTTYRSNEEIMKDSLASAATHSAFDVDTASDPLAALAAAAANPPSSSTSPPVVAVGGGAAAASLTAGKIAALAGNTTIERGTNDATLAANSSEAKPNASADCKNNSAHSADSDDADVQSLACNPSSPASVSRRTSDGSDAHFGSGSSKLSPSPSSSTLNVKATRTVPAPNPFRPRRSSAYQSGPSLCDVDFPFLNAAFGESFLAKKNRIRAQSPFAESIGPDRWDLLSAIFKGGDDLRQEVLAMQFITAFDRIFRAAKLPLFLKPYSVVITSVDSGLIETIGDAVSIDGLKKRLFPHWTCLTDFYAAYWGGCELQGIIDGQDEFLKKYPCDYGLVTYQAALRNFVESMAAYSLVTWFLQIKDRHNGNIMISRAGHIIHIDFGFMLSNSPGGNWNWEQAPFKLTQEFIDVMGGTNSDLFAYFRMLVIRGFLEARAHVDEFVVLCDVHAHTSHMPCFSGPAAAASPNGVIDAMRQRFAMHLKTEAEVEKYVDELIDSSINNWRSTKYDKFQKLTNGIL